MPLPGGDFPVNGVTKLVEELLAKYPFLSHNWARRLVKAYGTEASEVLRNAKTPVALGRDFGATLSEAEIRWLIAKEYARSADDVVWRRTKLGLRMTVDQIAALDVWMRMAIAESAA